MNGEFCGKKLLITGASGFIGRHLVRRLLREGAVPHLLVRPSHAQALMGEAGPCTVIAAELTNSDAVALAVRETAPEIIVHLAGYTDPARDLARTNVAMAANFTATFVLSQAAKEVGCKRFVTTGSAEEYGRQTAPLSETLPERPLSPYSASKAATTQWIRMLSQTYDFPGVVVRPFLVYGPGQPPPKLVPSAVLAAISNQDFPMTLGQQRRELTFVEDVVDGLLKVASPTRSLGDDPVFNLGSGQALKVLSIVERIYAVAGATGKICTGALEDRHNDMQQFIADTRRAHAFLDWQATTQLDDGLDQTIRWARDNGNKPVPLLS